MKKRTPVDRYLDWIPLVSIVLGIIVCAGKTASALPYALPVLAVWACSKLVSKWMNSPPLSQTYSVGAAERKLAKRTFLKSWRFFVEFSTERNNWLDPRQCPGESPNNCGASVADQSRLSTEYQAGSLRVRIAHLAGVGDLTAHTLDAVVQLPLYEGHFYNWYDTVTLKPMEPLFLSTVDNGNLVASLWALKQGFTNS